MTRVAIETRILSLYVAGSEAEVFNVSEIAKGVGAAYPHTHAAVKRMIRDGILSAITVGKSILCSVNLENDLARNLLAQAQCRRKASLLSRPNLLNLDAEMRRIAAEEPQVIVAILNKEGIRFIVTERKAAMAVLRRTSMLGLSFSDPDEFRAELLTSMRTLDGSTILFGYDRLLLILLPIHRQLSLNHARCFRAIAVNSAAVGSSRTASALRAPRRPKAKEVAR